MTSRFTSTVGRTNWAGNYAYWPARFHEPESIEEAQEIVRAASAVRVLGSRHSFNDIADTPGDQISLARIPRTIEFDVPRQRVTVHGGIRYGELCGLLDEAGWALHNLASLPHISVAGACATASHGSGDRSGNLATAVASMEVVTADGELGTFDRGRDGGGVEFDGAVVSLGGLGVVTKLTLDVQPTFRVRQDVYEHLPFARLVDEFDEITSSADSVSLFTDWRGSTFDEVWLKRRVATGSPFEPSPDFHGATLATVALHPIRSLPADACTQQLGVEGPWHERLPHFRLDHTPSSGAELQTEYVVPRSSAVDALLALDAIGDRIAPLVHLREAARIRRPPALPRSCG